MHDDDPLPTVGTLDELAAMVEHSDHLYVRWSPGPHRDLARTSKDELTGTDLPGLSANSMRIEEWWGDRSPRLWVARRLYDYHHLQHQRDPEARPWIMTARETGRGPDNETLVGNVEPVAWIGQRVVAEAKGAVEDLRDDWGPLARSEGNGA